MTYLACVTVTAAELSRPCQVCLTAFDPRKLTFTMTASRLVLAVVLSAVLVASDRNSFDCAMRNLAVEFAAAQNPSLSNAKMTQIADALNGSPEKAAGCVVTVPPALASARAAVPRFGVFPLPTVGTAAGTFYVDYVRGSDSNDGSQGAPFKTVAAAVAATRAGGGGGAIVLRGGTHYLAAQIDLTAADSGLAVSAYPGEEAWLSRGVVRARAASRCARGTLAGRRNRHATR